MDYRERADIYTVVVKDDGMGGKKETKKKVATIGCKVAPYTVKTINSAGLPFTYSKNKLFTKDTDFLDDIYCDYYIVHKGTTYKKKTVMYTKKCLIIEMERVESNEHNNNSRK